MKKLHAKSPCCKASMQRFGKRRRRCSSCLKTWRIRQKKRGRKKKRAPEDRIIRFFEKRLPPLRIAAKYKGCSKDALQLLLVRSLSRYVAKNRSGWRKLLAGNEPLIAVVDAMWYRVRGQKYTIYVILLRPISKSRAVVLPPVLHPGHETRDGWEHALDSIPTSVRNRIVALVSDGAKSLMNIASKKEWVVQRCHFHLIAAVQNYLTTGPRSRHRTFALRVMKLTQNTLGTNDPKRLQPLLQELETIQRNTKSRGLKRVLRGFMANLDDYHAYLRYPELHLPSTSNSAESFIQCIRDLMYRCRGFRSFTSLKRWLIGLSIFKKTICCNGKNQPN